MRLDMLPNARYPYEKTGKPRFLVRVSRVWVYVTIEPKRFSKVYEGSYIYISTNIANVSIPSELFIKPYAQVVHLCLLDYSFIVNRRVRPGGVLLISPVNCYRY